MLKQLEKIVNKYFPLWLMSIGKRLIARPRYKFQLMLGKKEYEKYAEKYPQKILFVAGLPKSGTTWLEKMLCCIEGFQDVMPPSAVVYEQMNKQSHKFEFSQKILDDLHNSLSVLKLHSHGSENNYSILKKNNIKFVVLYRDLRDVAISYVFYIKRTPHHPEHKLYQNLDVKEALRYFGNTMVVDYVKWVDSWSKFNNDKLCYFVSYEELKQNTEVEFSNILKHFEIKLLREEVVEIIDSNTFKKLSGGRKEGKPDKQSFFRKGISGDWVNYFDDDIKVLYKDKLGDFLIRYGYERNNNW